ncbi:hypothetical protein JTB14_014435 [Gonioctena quinquepunctata]|nr:hypothetical protein JTB14_014435 [Gonioctena quinquepunctata]
MEGWQIVKFIEDNDMVEAVPAFWIFEESGGYKCRWPDTISGAEVTKLIHVGGTDLIEVIRRCMPQLVDDDILRQFSWVGGKGRKTFSTLDLATLFKARQNIPFCGHRDDGELFNTSRVDEGNFRELLRFRIEAGDRVLEVHLRMTSSKATYISKTTQNQLIHFCSEEIISTIITKIKSVKFYSIMFDETTDISHDSQMSLVMRYLQGSEVKENFVGFIDCHTEKYELDPDTMEPVLTVLGRKAQNYASALKNSSFIQVAPEKNLDLGAANDAVLSTLVVLKENRQEHFNSQEFKSKLRFWKAKWVKTSEEKLPIPDEALGALAHCDKVMFPLITSFLEILITLPISVASSERSFSSLRRIKS